MSGGVWIRDIVAALLLVPLLLLAPAVTEAHQLYTDADLISPWAYASIHEATERGIVAGSGGAINAQGYITRAEFTTLIVSMLGIATDNSDVLPFDDVAEGDWFYPYVHTAYSEQVVSGFTSSQFLPSGHITRQEMAAMLVRALAIDHRYADVALQDSADVAMWARPAVNAIVATGLMQGDNDYFRPRDLATREMAIVVAMRADRYTSGEVAAEVEVEVEVAVEAAEGAVRSERSEQIRQLIRTNAAFMQHMVPDPAVGSTAGEWTILGLARSGEPVPDDYYATYYENVVAEVKKLMPATASKADGRLHRNKGTEHSRLMLGLTAIGQSIYDVGGYDLRQALADFQYVGIQGINGPIFALIAFDSLDYEIPVDANVNVQTTREGLIDYILSREIKGGGWALGANPEVPDADITAMAIQGLTPYYTERPDVREAIDSGVSWLSAAQDASGGFRSWGALNSESAAQVIVALSGLGMDADTDPRFVKGGFSALDALLSFAAADGGFYHILAGEHGNGGAAPGVVDAMATDQAMYALVAYERFMQGTTPLYDMTDRISGTYTPSSLKGR